MVGAGDRASDLLGIPSRMPSAAANDPAYKEVLYRSGVERLDGAATAPAPAALSKLREALAEGLEPSARS